MRQPRNKAGQFVPRHCPECGNGDLVYEDGFWICNGLADPGDDNKPLETCAYHVEASISDTKP